ncbi:unnamed protein product [Prorocentrum cordatum]|uniref:Uncharacterized protein n=1 Tax=Prorocentrum cordatum TaxID=2364126 RepID=A0ABN9PLH8_9DINO|nr:unnamed protein product [Polarella glacialis]
MPDLTLASRGQLDGSLCVPFALITPCPPFVPAVAGAKPGARARAPAARREGLRSGRWSRAGGQGLAHGSAGGVHGGEQDRGGLAAARGAAQGHARGLPRGRRPSGRRRGREDTLLREGRGDVAGRRVAEGALAKLERNRAKLQQAEAAACAAQARAQVSLDNMEARRETLCALASDVVSSTLLALRASTARVPTASSQEADSAKSDVAAMHVSQSTPEEPPPRATTQEGPPGAAPTALPGPNPFSADVGRCRRLDLPPPERLEGACRSDPRATMGPSMASWTNSQGPPPGSVLRPPEAGAARARMGCAPPRCLQLLPCARLR